MAFVDPIGDMITRIRNAQMRSLSKVKIPSSKLRVRILDVLKKEGYISDYKLTSEDSNKNTLSIDLKYTNGSPVIREIRRISKPGRRIYARADSIPKIQNGLGVAIISTSKGNAVAYALWNLEERGPLFVEPGEKVYCGMLIGEHNKGQDIEANPLKTKQLTNVRASGSDDAIMLTPPIKLTLERAIAYIADDELVEVTPQSIRLRKKFLDPNDRKRETRRVTAKH